MKGTYANLWNDYVTWGIIEYTFCKLHSSPEIVYIFCKPQNERVRTDTLLRNQHQQQHGLARTFKLLNSGTTCA